jgi:hypothetical protein
MALLDVTIGFVRALEPSFPIPPPVLASARLADDAVDAIDPEEEEECRFRLVACANGYKRYDRFIRWASNCDKQLRSGNSDDGLQMRLPPLNSTESPGRIVPL